MMPSTHAGSRTRGRSAWSSVAFTGQEPLERVFAVGSIHGDDLVDDEVKAGLVEQSEIGIGP